METKYNSSIIKNQASFSSTIKNIVSWPDESPHPGVIVRKSISNRSARTIKSSWKERLAIRAQRRIRKIDEKIGRLGEHVDDWDTYSPFRNNLVDLMLWCDARMFGRMEMSYEWLAAQKGCSTKTVQRLTDDLCDAGILTKQWRYKKTNIYTLSAVVYTPQFRKKFSSIFGALRIPISDFSRFFKEPSYLSDPKGVHLSYPSYYNIYLNDGTGRDTMVQPVQIVRGTNSREPTASFSIKKRERENMLYPYTEKLCTSQWKLTLAGRIKLQPFPEHIIQRVWEGEAWKTAASKNWGALILLLRNACYHENIKPDWSQEKLLEQQYNVKHTDRYISFVPHRNFTPSREPLNSPQKRITNNPFLGETSSYAPSNQHVTPRQPSSFKPIGTVYQTLTPEETNQRRHDFITHPDMPESMEKLSSLIGQKNAEAFFARVLANLNKKEER